VRLLLAENLPLRTTRMLGDYAVDAPLAHRYGDLSAARFPLLRLSDTVFFAADHPMEIDRVFIDDTETLAWETGTKSDDSGHTWQIVTAGSPVAAGSNVSATGKGKRNPRTGALLENPADIIENVLLLAGRVEDWSALRAECSAESLRIAGSISTIKSIRATLDDITQSVAAIWTPGMARLYPVLAVNGPVIELTKARAQNLAVTTDLTDTADILRLSYDQDDATNKPQRYIELTANPQRFGGVVFELTLPWLRSSANAESVGRRLLSRLAGERYDVSLDSTRRDIRPGQWLRPVANPSWPFTGADPVIMVIEAQIDQKQDGLSGEAIVSMPEISVTGHSVALSSITQGGVDVSYKNGIATFRFTDPSGNPIKNARVSFDGGQAKTTDDQGVVSFTASPGQHKLAAEAVGYTPIEADVTL
jgi:hypothetical protein